MLDRSEAIWFKLLVATTILGFVLLILSLPIAYIERRTSTPELSLREEALFNERQSHSGVDFGKQCWVFYENSQVFKEADFADEGAELWYAGFVCSLLGLECRFTPPFAYPTGEYIKIDRGWYKIFVSDQDIDRFERVWKPIITLRFWKYQ